MEKAVYALWRRPGTDTDELRDRLLGEVAGELAGAGVRGLQVNVSDTAVAGAMMRLTTFEQPVDAVVSVWSDAAHASARVRWESALTAVAGRVAGWLVTESVPMAAPAGGPGERAPGLANVAFLRRPAAMTPADWLDRWHEHHTPVAIATQATFGYVQNTVARPLTDGAPAVEGIVEEVFPMEALTDLHAFYGSGGDDEELKRRMAELMRSCDTFLEATAVDVVPTSRYVVSTPFA